MPTAVDYAVLAANGSDRLPTGGAALYAPRRKRWTPDANARLNRDHPLAAGLAFCFVPSTGFADHASGVRGVNNGMGSGVGGAGRSATSSDDGYAAFSGIPDDAFTGPLTLEWFGVINAGNRYNHFMGKHAGNGSTANPFDFRTDSSPTPKGVVVRSGGSAAGTSSSLPVGTPVHVVFAFETGIGGGNYVAYVNGKVDAIWTSGGTSAVTGSGADIRVGKRADDFVKLSGSVFAARAWSRQLSTAEVVALYADPFQMFEAPRIVGVETSEPAPAGISGMARLYLAVVERLTGVKGAAGAARVPSGDAAQAAGAKATSGAARSSIGTAVRSSGLKGISGKATAFVGTAFRPAGAKGASGAALTAEGVAMAAGGTKSIVGSFLDGGGRLALGASLRVAGSKLATGAARLSIGTAAKSSGSKAATGAARTTEGVTLRGAGSKGGAGGARIAQGVFGQTGAGKGVTGRLRAFLGLVAAARKRGTTGLVSCIELTAHPVVSIELSAPPGRRDHP